MTSTPSRTCAVVGAGPTGVELAGQIRELATRTLRAEFQHIQLASTSCPASSRAAAAQRPGEEPAETPADDHDAVSCGALHSALWCSGPPVSGGVGRGSAGWVVPGVAVGEQAVGLLGPVGARNCAHSP